MNKHDLLSLIDDAASQYSNYNNINDKKKINIK